MPAKTHSSPSGEKYKDFKRISEKRLGQKKWRDQKGKEFISTLMEDWGRDNSNWVIS